MEWIQCSNRQPEKFDEYNVVWDLGDDLEPTVTTMEYDPKEKKWIDVHGFVNSDCTESITHWMPLPEAPKTNG